MGDELRARIWYSCCPHSGLTLKQLERHVEAIAATVERTRIRQKTMRRGRVA